METLNQLFGDRVRVKIIRLFLLNPGKVYEPRQVMEVARGTRRIVEREISAFKRAGLIKRRRAVGVSSKKQKRGVFGWTLNPSFLYLPQLRSLVANGVLLKSRDVVARLSRGGTLKLVVLAGIFLQDWDSRVDLLIVGDKLRRGILNRSIRSIESEIGRELHYAILDTPDFQYRLSVGDKLIRDVFDYSHQIVVNKLGIEK